MSKFTGKAYRNQVMYSVFVRNHTPEGTFEGVRRDLERIRALGADIIWLLPIHPTGEKCRKGALGSPYAIRDYRAVNPEYGTLDDFRRLVDEIHRLGMKCVIDVVYNHTSPDSVLAREHPEWFFHRPDGSFGNRVGDWWDVIDLDYAQPGLWDYQIDTLKYWASMVDGFRCDVAPLVPLEFWLRVRREVEAVRPGCFWLAESVEPAFVRGGRAGGLPVLSDSELYQAFDVCYDYDIFGVFQDYVDEKRLLKEYAQAVNSQEIIYPENYVKLRFLENHDRARAAAILPNRKVRLSWTAFLFFQKGMTLLYAGQEASCTHQPSLFDRDTVDWSAGEDISALLKNLAALKKHPLLADSWYQVTALPLDTLLAVHRKGNRQLVGIFDLYNPSRTAMMDNRFRTEAVSVPVEAPDGRYPNLAFPGETVEVLRGTVGVSSRPIIFEAPIG